MKVAVGSKNPVKIEATKLAFEKVFPNETWELIGIDVGSEVSDQPMSDKESITGARNRATKSIKALKADYGVGLEGGLQEIEGNWFDSGWIVIVDKNGNEGIGSTISMLNAPQFIKLVKEGYELGIVDDMIFKTENSKHDQGHFGLMSKGAITRTRAYSDAVISALVRFINAELFE